MNRLQLTTTSVWLAFFVAACGGTSNTSSGSGGNNSVGTSTGGTQANSSTSGNNATGGSQSTQTTGTKTGTGGTSAAASAAGGAATGGASTAGGKSATGGASAAGGAATGGAAAGGASAAGGAATGGAAAGGANPGQGGSTGAGGTNAAGGTTAATSGGAGTGGAAGGASSTAPSQPTVVTSNQTTQWVTTGTVTPVTTGTADVTLGSAQQEFVGFGGTFNEVGWNVMKNLTDAQKSAVMAALFDANAGINFAWGRIPIGASDYGLTEYTLDDTSGNTADATMSSFSIDHDKTNLIPFINAALAVKSDIKFWASPWTPPAWMKSNKSLEAAAGVATPARGGSYATSDGYFLSANAAAWALYLEKFVQAYGALSPAIKISAIVPQNEPGYGNPYPSCYWDENTYISFIGTLGALFAKDSISTDIWAGTMSKETDGTIAVDAWADNTAKTYLKGSGLQWNTFANVGALKGKGTLVMTEHKCGNYNFATSTPNNDISWTTSQYSSSAPQNDYPYGIETWYLIRDWVQAGVNSYNAWNMVLDSSGVNLNKTTPWHQDGLIVVNGTTVTYTPAYYVFRHVSQFLKLPATLVSTTGSLTSQGKYQEALAFKNADGSYVVTVYNSGSSAKTLTVSVNSKLWQFSAPSKGWATLYVPAS